MRLSTMRILDYYLGRPLCALATLWLKLFSRPHGVPGPRRVLFIELSEMGSAILADPAMRWTREQGAELHFVIFERNAGSLRLLDTVPGENVFRMREASLWTFALDFARFILWARRKRIDSVIDLELFSRATALMTAFSGARERVGFFRFHQEGLYRGDTLTRRVAYNPHIHIAKNFMALARSLFAPPDQIPFYKGEIRDEDIQLNEAQTSTESIGRVQRALLDVGAAPGTQWVLLNCGGGHFLPQRRWPAAYYATLARTILDNHPRARILLTGSEDERAELAGIESLIRDARVVNFANAVALEDLPALYRMATLMISNDSGAAHFAAVTRLPTYVFFGPESPSLYGSLGNFHALYAGIACSPCVSAWNHRSTPCRDNICLQLITPDKVYERVRRNLSPTTSASDQRSSSPSAH